MKKVQTYIEKLKGLKDWDEFLMQESCLPGPRANLELMEAAAIVGDETRFNYFLTYTAEKAPVNTPEGFLACCGTVGLGKLIKMGKTEYLENLRLLASDPRWRIRECVAIALQIYGEQNMEELTKKMAAWVIGNCYEQRAAAAALCEPKLLTNKDQTYKVLKILDDITHSILDIKDRKDEGFQALRKGLAYCWSVAIVGNPDEGEKIFEKWISSNDKDIKWIIKENLKKDRLNRMDKEWTQSLNKFISCHNNSG